MQLLDFDTRQFIFVVTLPESALLRCFNIYKDMLLKFIEEQKHVIQQCYAILYLKPTKFHGEKGTNIF